jgi:hypothetical protein
MSGILLRRKLKPATNVAGFFRLAKDQRRDLMGAPVSERFTALDPANYA